MPAELPLDLHALIRRALHRQVRLPEFSQPVYIEDAQTIDDLDLLSLAVRTRDGQTAQTIISAADLALALDQSATQLSSTQSLANPLDFFLLVEAARIRLAYSFDPFFAVSMSGVQALPHQLQAVYERMLPQARLRFLLADDPGAGKTIMAGLLLKELKLRGVITYVLILTPAPLTIQWQDELYSKFDETYEVVNSDMVGNQLAGNVWERYRQCIASLDFAKQEKITQSLEQIPWDLIIIDEAHKCAARSQGEKAAKTRRYQLAERLSASAERILLLTATPHSGDPSQFAHFLRLLDADQFPDPRYDGLQLDRKILEDSRSGGRDQWFLRRIKEELRDREGNPLFTKRHVSTVPFPLTWAELRLYDRVTAYINRFLPYQQGSVRRNSVALARTVLQRRLASSLNAIHRSLERRTHHFSGILQELERLPASEHEKILQKYRLLASSGYEDEESDSGDLDELQEEAMENGSGSHENAGPFTVVAMEKEAQTSFMHKQRFGERKRLANKTSQTLSQRIIPALYMCRFSCFLSYRCMLLFWNHCLVDFPKVGVAMPSPIGLRNGFPQCAAGLFTSISYGICHYLSCLSTQRYPDPRLLGLLQHK